MKFLWEKLNAYKEWILVTVPNRYMGLGLFLMLLVIYLKQSILKMGALEAHFINCLTRRLNDIR